MAGLAGFLLFPQCGPRGRAVKVWGGGSGPAEQLWGLEAPWGRERPGWCEAWELGLLQGEVYCLLPATTYHLVLTFSLTVACSLCRGSKSLDIPPSEAGVWHQPTLREGLPDVYRPLCPTAAGGVRFSTLMPLIGTHDLFSLWCVQQCGSDRERKQER